MNWVKGIFCLRSFHIPKIYFEAKSRLVLLLVRAGHFNLYGLPEWIIFVRKLYQKAVLNFSIPHLNKAWNLGVFFTFWVFFPFTSYHDWTFFITLFMTQFPLTSLHIWFAVYIVYFYLRALKLGSAVYCDSGNLFCWPHLASITWCLHFQVLYTCVL